jgi:hypothetical protein
MATFTTYDAIIDNLVIDLTAVVVPGADANASPIDLARARNLRNRLQLEQRRIDQTRAS